MTTWAPGAEKMPPKVRSLPFAIILIIIIITIITVIMMIIIILRIVMKTCAAKALQLRESA